MIVHEATILPITYIFKLLQVEGAKVFYKLITLQFVLYFLQKASDKVYANYL